MNTLESPDSRQNRLSRMLGRSIDPYSPYFDRTHRISEVADLPGQIDSKVRVAGWVQDFCFERDGARLVIEDGSARITLVIPRESCEALRQLLELLDPGDIAGVDR